MKILILIALLLSSPLLAEDNLVVLFPINPGIQLTGEQAGEPAAPDTGYWHLEFAHRHLGEAGLSYQYRSRGFVTECPVGAWASDQSASSKKTRIESHQYASLLNFSLEKGICVPAMADEVPPAADWQSWSNSSPGQTRVLTSQGSVVLLSGVHQANFPATPCFSIGFFMGAHTTPPNQHTWFWKESGMCGGSLATNGWTATADLAHVTINIRSNF